MAILDRRGGRKKEGGREGGEGRGEGEGGERGRLRTLKFDETQHKV